VNNAEIALDFERAEKLAGGNDSDVFLCDSLVYKEYHRLDEDRVCRYADLVNEGAGALERLGYTGIIQIESVGYQFQFRGLPVRQAGMGPRGRAMTVSDYICEPNLDKLTQRPEHFAAYPIGRVPSLEQRRFFVRLNRLFFTELPTRVQDEFHYHTDIVSRLLDAELGVFGIYIGKYNIKLLPDLQDRTLTLVVTDLAVYIERLCLDRQVEPTRTSG
jgi:hypothetical protein